MQGFFACHHSRQRVAVILVRQRPVNVHAPQAPGQYEHYHVQNSLPYAFLKLVMFGLNDRNGHRR